MSNNNQMFRYLSIFSSLCSRLENMTNIMGFCRTLCQDSYLTFILVNRVRFVDFSNNKNENWKKEETSNPTSKPKQDEKKDPKSSSPSVDRDKKNPMGSGGCGRGKKK